MWSAVFSKSCLYLGSQLALAKRAGGPIRLLDFPVGVSVEERLGALAGIFQPSGKVVVHLSGALSPAVPLAIPPGVQRFGERLAYARAMAARALSAVEDEVRCEFDPLNPIACSAVHVGVLDAIESWAKRERLKIASVAPLWSVLSASFEAATSSDIQLEEADSATVMSSASASTVPSYESLPAAPDALRVRFARAPEDPHSRLLPMWQGHWVQE